MDNNKLKILVVDDEESLCEILQFNLIAEGYEADVAYSAEQALKLPLENYSLILLDIMMGAISGLKMAQMMKQDPKLADIPIIFITAKDEEEDTILGLNLGADDYIAKPFAIREVLARIKSVLRRAIKSDDSKSQEIIEFESLKVDINKRCCTLDDEEIKLTHTELELLTLFLRNRGRIFTREEILKRIWSDEVIVLDRTIDVNITRLRKKIGRYGKYIITRLGYGYGFDV
jgi:two-component system alkaline phosphatase synthesis response regulator PhoP